MKISSLRFLRWFCRLMTLVLVTFFMQPAHAKKTRHLWEYKKSHFNMYSLNDDLDIGKTVQKQQMDAFQKKNIAMDPPHYAATKKRIETIVARLAKVSDMPGLPYEVHIYDMPDVVNAYCMPGGKIGIFTGLFDSKKGLVNEKSDDEIAAVLGHEMAHATMRHVTRTMTTYNGLGVLGSLLSVGVQKSVGANWQSVFDQVFSTSASLSFPSYSRRYEKEADQVGFYYMVKAGFDPNAAVQIWQRAAEKKNKNDKTTFFSDHPGNRDRANQLRAYLPDAESVKQQMKLVEAAKREK